MGRLVAVKRKVAYVAGPYRAATARGVVENIRRAEAVALELWARGYVAICPHKNTSLFDGALPDSAWLEGDLEILRRCDLVVCTDDYQRSSGARREVELAIELSIPAYETLDDVPFERPWSES